MNFNNLCKSAAFIAAFTILLSLQHANAQSSNDSQGWRFGIGIEPGVPVGQIHNDSNFELGGTVRLQYDLKSPVSLIFTSGYYEFFGRTGNGFFGRYKTPNGGVVPIKAGVKVFFIPHAYISGEAGAAFSTASDNNVTKLVLAPGIGFATNSGIDVGIHYDHFSGQEENFGLLALRVAYGFKL